MGAEEQTLEDGSSERRRIAGLTAAGIVTASLGLGSLLGWLLDIPRLAAMGAGLIPMAPSAALLFVLWGLMLLVRAHRPTDRASWWTSLIVAGATALVGIAVLAAARLGIQPEVEHLGMDIKGTVGGARVGHMSPVTAACFLLASLSSTASLRGQAPSWRHTVAFASAGVLLATACSFLLAYAYGVPLLYDTGLTPPAANTAIGFAVLGLALLVVAKKRQGSSGSTTDRDRSWVHLLWAFVVLAAALFAGGFFFQQRAERQYRAEVERQLQAIASLKIFGIAHWRAERLRDGEALFRNDSFSDLVERAMAPPGDPHSLELLQVWLHRLQVAYGYDRVFLVDPQGGVLAASHVEREPVAPHLMSELSESVAAPRVSMLDFHRDEPGSPIRLAVTVPILSSRDASKRLGTVVLRIDPHQYLYPFIQQWPTSSESAETLLVRRDGEEALFLNELRFRKNTALELRLSLRDSTIPAARAALGHEGVIEAGDYRGVKVIAALRTIPDSPWFVVAKIDADEVYGPLRERLWQMALTVLALVFGAGAALGVVWRQHNLRFYRERALASEALHSSDLRFRALVDHAPVAIFINRDDRVVEANQVCLQLFGASSKEQLLGKSPYELFHPDSHPLIRDRIRQLREHGAAVPLIEERIVRLDGSTVDVEVTAAPFPDQGTRAIHVVLRDITERKRADDALRTSEQELRARNDELMRFSYTVSHDLKSPLVTIQTFVGYLTQDLAKQDAASADKDLGFIRSAASKMGRLLDDILELSRIGRKMNPPQQVMLADVVRDALELVAGRIASRGVQVEVQEAPVRLFGDRTRLVQVFQNLVDNAAKFMGDQPAPRVEIGAELLDGETVLYVRDNGTGIDPRHRARLFGLFEKLDPGTDGTGIGLALVRRIVEMHGGRIWVESEGRGKGACFRFTLAKTLLNAEIERKT